MTVSLASTEPLTLTGTWSLRRRVHDRLSGRFGRACGTLTITDGGEWIEQGRLELADRHASFERRLAVRLLDDEWWVTFADGRQFHPWRLDEPVNHPCGDDLYRGRVTLSAAGEVLRVLWDVTGPVKSQRLFTTFRRLDTR